VQIKIIKSSKLYCNISNSTSIVSNLFLIIFFLSVDELRKLLSDKDAYHQFLLSLDQVKIQNNVSHGL
jgi:ESCRT-I complex subunit VPS37